VPGDAAVRREDGERDESRVARAQDRAARRRVVEVADGNERLGDGGDLPCGRGSGLPD
jgi:hypothetical protein